MKIRRFCSGLLAAVLLLGLMALPAGAAAASTVSTEEAIQVINALGIMVGDESGEFHLNRRVTRAEFITMAVNATGTGDQVGEASTSPYPDVPRTHWAAGYVQAGVQAGLISGYLDGTFRPSNQITLAEGATIVLKLLGYTAEDFSGAYPTGQLAMYRNLKLDRGVTAQKSTDVLTRQDTLYLFYNLLSTNTKEGTPYINKLGYSLNAAGEVDRVALVNGVMEGPVVVAGSWQQSVPFDVDSARVYRDGAASSAKSIQNNDIVYWSESMQTLWVYTDRVAGTIQELSPTPSNPTSVKVAGQTYEIETASAAYELSDLGSYQVGDTVTLLLGRNGGVAAVAAASASQDGSKIGIVTNLSRGTYSGSGANSSYTADTVTILATDGRTYSYQWTTDYFKLGNLVQVVISSEDGSVSLKRLDYRMEWEDDLRDYLMSLDRHKPVVYCGDLNVAHREIDLKNPKTNRNNAGFTDQEREKMTCLLSSGFTDSFRYLYPDTEGIYSWWSYRFNARKNNAGWRIDYFIVSDRLRDKIKRAEILTTVEGSDHCPVLLELDI